MLAVSVPATAEAPLQLAYLARRGHPSRMLALVNAVGVGWSAMRSTASSH